MSNAVEELENIFNPLPEAVRNVWPDAKVIAVVKDGVIMKP